MPLPDAAVLVAGGAAALPSTARFAPAVPDGRRAGSDGPAWRGAWQRIERAFDAVFGAAANPLRHLGALGFFFFWWLVGSGIYLFAALDTSVVAAHASIADLAERPWYAGGWLRSVHRYAADGFVVVLLLHLVREWLLGRYRGVRRYAWWTGIPLLLFAFASGIGGFWLHWDQLGQYSAQATAEWLDALPLAGARVAHNFAATAAVGDRLFSLFIFVHVGVALLMLFGFWFHVRRIAHADVFPPARLALATTLGLLALAAVAPVTSHPPADLSHAPGALRLDWFLLFVHPLVERTSPEVGWALVVAALLTLFLLPLLPRGRAAPATAPPAEV
ncbi:MAG: cytochrome b N-terminal domain-containing protein, partial [Caldimonas sp.]